MDAPRPSLRGEIAALVLLALPFALSSVPLPGFPGAGLTRSKVFLFVSLYNGSALAWALLPCVAVWHVAMTLTAHAEDEVGPRERRARRMIELSAPVLSIALAFMRVRDIMRAFAWASPVTQPPVAGLILQGVVLVALVLVAVEVTRRTGAAAIAALVVGDGVASDLNVLRMQGTTIGTFVRDHRTEVGAVALGLALLTLVLREAPKGRLGGAARLRPLAPVVLGAMAKATLVAALIIEWVMDERVSSELIETGAALALLGGGVVLAAWVPLEKARRVGLTLLLPAELAALPVLSSSLVATAILWRDASRSTDPYLVGPIGSVFDFVASNRELVASACGGAVLLATFALVRRARDPELTER